jgi:hypothetical protein
VQRGAEVVGGRRVEALQSPVGERLRSHERLDFVSRKKPFAARN